MRTSIILLGLAGCEVPDAAPNPAEQVVRERLGAEAWEDMAPHAHARLGAIVTTGDLDGDGKAEIFASGRWAFDPGWRAGAVTIYSGADPRAVLVTLEGEDQKSAFGAAIAVADVSGDGYADVLVGAPLYDSRPGEHDEGAVYLFLGGSGGVSRLPAWVYEGGQERAMLGRSITVLGDLDSDGAAEFAVGAPGWSGVSAFQGKIVEFAGGPSPTVLGETSASPAHGLEGWSVAAVHDWSGDGRTFIAAGAVGNLPGTVRLYDAVGLGLEASYSVPGTQFGYALAGDHDLDGDGRQDLVVGDPMVASVWVQTDHGSAMYTLPDGHHTRFGASVAAGDFEGDGRVDVLVGAPGLTDTDLRQGAAYELRNQGAIDTMTWEWSQLGLEADGRLGRSVAAGDVDGDGVDDAVLGAPRAGGTAKTGRVELHLGQLDADGDGFPITWDCNDGDAGIGGPTPWYLDLDADGYGDANFETAACAMPGGYAAAASDCDDGDPLTNPDADEACNDNDDDCDTEVNEDFGAGDGCTSGFGECAAPGLIECDPDGLGAHCNAVEGTPGSETCNGLDDDCNGVPDDGIGTTWYLDEDSDGVGGSVQTLVACFEPTGFVAIDGDCDDSDPNVGSPTPWYVDLDGDGYGDPTEESVACAAPTGRVGIGGDCLDTPGGGELVHPGAIEVCNDTDDDCDGLVDEDVGPAQYPDADSDSFGDAYLDPIHACSPLSGYTPDNTDCDDTRSTANPAAAELCNQLDDDCDGAIDDGAGFLVYTDGDADGYGDPASVLATCTYLSGYIVVGGDCDDANGGIHPGATESCDGVDTNCNGTPDDEGAIGCQHSDADGDGWGASACVCNPVGSSGVYPDCYDNNPAAYPNAAGYHNVSRGDGSYDYNCDAIQSPEKAQAFCMMQVVFVPPSSIDFVCAPTAGGFWYAVPACGDYGYKVLCGGGLFDCRVVGADLTTSYQNYCK